MSLFLRTILPLSMLSVAMGSACSEYDLRGQLGTASPADLPQTIPSTTTVVWTPTVGTKTPMEETKPCALERQVTELHIVEFPATSGCAWERGDNLSPLDSYMRAIETQTVAFPLEEGEVLCDLRVEFAIDEGGLSFPLQYDDQLLFTFNDRVVFSSDERLVAPLSLDAAGLATFDWLAIRDMEMSFFATPWAVGTGFTVDLPGHDVLGDAEIAIDSSAISSLTSAAYDAAEVVLELHSFGDNDETDCGHTGMSFWLELDIGR